MEGYPAAMPKICLDSPRSSALAFPQGPTESLQNAATVVNFQAKATKHAIIQNMLLCTASCLYVDMVVILLLLCITFSCTVSRLRAYRANVALWMQRKRTLVEGSS